MIPRIILNKPKGKKFNLEEVILMRSHPKKGAEILNNMQNINKIIIAIALKHHINLDQTGYPEDIPDKVLDKFVLVTKLIDIIDALASDRSYKKGLTTEEIEEKIKIFATNLELSKNTVEFVLKNNSKVLKTLVNISKGKEND